MKTLLSMALFVPLLGSLSFPQALWGAGCAGRTRSEGSLQSGIGVISGWVCEAERIEIVFHPDTDHAMTFQAGYGTNREDTAGECHDSNNGFGLLFNWNRLGDGQHTVSARADGVEFGRATVTVTTLGGEFLEEASGYFIVEDFSTPDEDIQLRWQQTTQNFVITANPALAGPAKTEAALFSPLMKNGQPPVSPLTGGGRPDSSPLTGGGTPARVLENPQPVSLQSGIGVISGWVCEAERIEIVFHPDTDHAMTFQAGYGTSREDTEGECHDSNNGFGLLFNWNRLGDGQHTVSARADGVEFGRATVTVTTFGQEFLEGVGKHARLQNFPETGTDLIVAWQQSLQNFTIARLDSLSPRIAAIDAIGDSISKAVNAQDQAPCPHDDQESFNWATSITAGARCSDGGDGVYSLAERIECRQGAMIVNADPNSGESGAEMLKDFFAQAQESAALLGTQPAPRYVTVEMGHNDICSGTLERIQADCAEGEDQDPINHCRTTPAAFEREVSQGPGCVADGPGVEHRHCRAGAGVSIVQPRHQNKLFHTGRKLCRPVGRGCCAPPHWGLRVYHARLL